MASAASAQIQQHPSERDFSVGFKLSLIFHLGLAIFILIKSLVLPSDPIVIVPNLRVDLVALPDVLKKDKANPLPKSVEPNLPDSAPAVEPKNEPVAKKATPIEPAQPNEMVLKPKQEGQPPKERKKDMKSALARIKALEKIRSDVGSPVAEAKPTLFKGNRISKGTSISDDAKESGETSYFDLIRDHLQNNWALPIWLARQKLSAQVQIQIDARGRLQSFRFLKVSGNAQFDESVKRTVADSQPYPIPPESVAAAVSGKGILVGFPL